MKLYIFRENKLVCLIKRIYARHVVGKLFATVILLAALIYVVRMIPVWSVKEQKVEETTSHVAEAGKEISKEKGKICVAKEGDKELYLDTETLVFEVKDTGAKAVFSTAVKGSKTGNELALLNVNYLGEDNNLHEWNSYDNCVTKGTYNIYEIENGVQLVMNFNEGESNRFYEHLPKKMSISRYKDFFEKGLEQAVTDGKVDADKGKKLERTLSLVYKKSIMEECYAVSYTGTPPANAVTQMIEIAKLIGYTQEMLMEDAEEFGFTVTFSEAPEFLITLEMTLEDGELVAHMPAGQMTSVNDYYTIQNIKVLPNFGAAEAAENEEGYIFVPDGSGALIAFNTYQATVSNYERPMFDNDYYKDYWFMPEYGEELFMPVYGMLYGPEDKSEKAFLAIVEDGARNAYIHTRLGSTGGDSSKYNKVYASFDINQYTKVKLNGPYSDDAGTFLVDTGMQNLDCTVRYQFFGRKTGYYELAKSYQHYLAEKIGVEPAYGSGNTKLYLEIIGALTVKKRLAGIPYSSRCSMTDYGELQSMMQDLDDVDLLVQYDGVFQGGMNNELSDEANLISCNGSWKELAALTEYAASREIPLYLSASLSQVGSKGNGFLASRHATRDFGDKEMLRYRYMPVMGIRYGDLYGIGAGDGFYTMAPQYLDGIVDGFLKDAKAYPQLAVTDLASMYYADYRFKGMVTGEQGDRVLNKNLAKMAEEKELALKNPHIDKIGYGDVAVDISRKSSEYATFDKTIPFRQLVMNGLITYTTTDVNLSSENMEYYVLQAAELGAYPKFTLTAKDTGILKDSEYSYLYSVQYDFWADRIKEMYQDCADIRSRIGTDEITGHICLADGVYETTYANGNIVTVNYNLFPVTLKNGGTIGAESYLIKEGK